MRQGTIPHFYTAEEIWFMRKKITGRGYAELTERFNRRFGLEMTFFQIAGAIKRYGLRNGRDCRFRPGSLSWNKGVKGIHLSRRTEFKPGNRPANQQPVGTERVNREGYVEVKVRNPNKWKAKHRIIWEQAYGKIPRGQVVIFADGNRRNLALDNLMLISRQELVVMNRLGLISPNKNLTQIGKTVADLKMLIADRKHGAKKNKKSRAKGTSREQK
jgi:hypothetical protein